MPPSRRGPYAKSRALKGRIAQAAYDLICEHGHENVSIADVAQAADIPESTLQYHFPTRDDILVAALAGRGEVDPASEAGHALLADPTGELERLVGEDMTHPASMRLYVELMARGTNPQHPAHPFIADQQRTGAAGIASLLRDLQHTGWAHPKVDPETFGQLMVAISDGLRVQWLVRQDFDLAEAVATAFRQLARHDVMEARRALEDLVDDL